MIGARAFARLLLVVSLPCALAVSQPARGQTRNVSAAAPTLVDRVAVRFYAPETGGPARPQFVSERVLALEARFEALGDGADVASATQERYVRAALERHIAEALLSSLLVEQGVEPPDLPHAVDAARAELAARVGGDANVRASMDAESIEDLELVALLRRRVRAAAYVDRSLTPILNPTEEQLREAFREQAHPFKEAKFEAVRVPFTRWLVEERLRATETSFFQAARARVTIVIPVL